ncbi:DsbA family protein [Vibrio mangrovi]|uniref:DSBA-like thioredoxin domain protein n=1 Tax=Vibrio mangrovi TaxID=474394 RepID=A0A1Y6IT87_9VIBR|nr:DsbA family protein [Vibrio mangrovi]MDW6004588.1 DsbA family protein [Vibrio mangrovi]SMS00877.1 DSBA-like thioredoxin domain protein [Vibrio mangrovi]
MVNVHYIFDPMCGWCYGASELIAQFDHMEEVHLQLHPGGMIQKTPISPDFRQHILEADKHIETQTGQPFGDTYVKKVASNDALVLDSYITAQAIIAAERLAQCGLKMLKQIQRAHYQSGLPVYQPETLAEIARQLGFSPEQWEQAMAAAQNDVDSEIQMTRQLMQRFGLGGFPSMVIEKNGQWQTVIISQYYGSPERWSAFWEKVLAA